jgi:hypothetical protein
VRNHGHGPRFELGGLAGLEQSPTGFELVAQPSPMLTATSDGGTGLTSTTSDQYRNPTDPATQDCIDAQDQVARRLNEHGVKRERPPPLMTSTVFMAISAFQESIEVSDCGLSLRFGFFHRRVS